MLCALDFACSTDLRTFHIVSREVAKGQATHSALQKYSSYFEAHFMEEKLEQVRQRQPTQPNGKRKFKLTLSASLSSCPSNTSQVVAASSPCCRADLRHSRSPEESRSSFPHRATWMLSTRSPPLPLTTGARILQNCDPQYRATRSWQNAPERQQKQGQGQRACSASK